MYILLSGLEDLLCIIPITMAKEVRSILNRLKTILRRRDGADFEGNPKEMRASD